MREGFQRFARRISDGVGTYRAFFAALAAIVIWGTLGPLFHFSDTWQLVVNTGTTIITFLVVFLIQATQNRETRALHLKLDELVRAQKRARNIFAHLEHATDDELNELEAEFQRIHVRAEERRAAKAGTAAQPEGH
jgi:low affinity Fe/Cu permease